VPSLSTRPPLRRVASFLVCAILALASTGAAAPVAFSAEVEGGSGAFNELSKQSQETATTQTTATTTSTEPTSNNKKTIVIALIAAVALLIGIAFVIVRDARRNAPVGDGLLTETSSGHDSAAIMRKRRAKAKAARQQRKRNQQRKR
jgi:hypothetical protein